MNLLRPKAAAAMRINPKIKAMADKAPLTKVLRARLAIPAMSINK
jgi:hypothetical protein